jgi:hypothetical protein
MTTADTITHESTLVVTATHTPPDCNKSSSDDLRLGVKVSFLKDFLTDYCEKSSSTRLPALLPPLPQCTIQDIYEAIVKPFTQLQSLSFCQFLLQQQQRTAEVIVGPATIHIVYSPTMNFMDFIDTLITHFSSQPNTMIWLDLFSSHHPHTLPLTASCRQPPVMDSTTVIVYHPSLFTDPSSLSALYSIGSSTQTTVELVISLQQVKGIVNRFEHQQQQQAQTSVVVIRNLFMPTVTTDISLPPYH